MCVRKGAYTGWPKYLVCLIFIGHFPQKSLIMSGSFAESDLHLKASYAFLPPCIWYLYAEICSVCVCVCLGGNISPHTHTHTHTSTYMCMCMWRYTHKSTYTYVYVYVEIYTYGVATISRLLKIIGLFCRISSLL